MIRHLAQASLLLLIVSAPVAAAPQMGGSNAVGPSPWHSITSKPTNGTTVSTGAGIQHKFPTVTQGQFGQPGAIDLHLECAFCTGHDGGVGQPN